MRLILETVLSLNNSCCYRRCSSVALNTPLVLYHILRYCRRPVLSCPGLHCPTSLLNRDNIRRNRTEGWTKLGFYVLLFFCYIYGFISSVIPDSNIP